MKIGSVAPDAIHKNVKTFRENIKNFHFIAPEWTGEIILFSKRGGRDIIVYSTLIKKKIKFLSYIRKFRM